MTNQSMKLLHLVAAVMMTPMPLLAQSQAEGVVSLRYFLTDDSAKGAAFGDFTLRAGLGRWEAGLGMYGVVGRLHETYAHLGYQHADLMLEAGFPRPSYDGFAVSPLDSIMPRFALERVGTTRSRTTYGTMVLPDYLPYGAVISGQVAGARWATSLHAVPDYDDTIFGVAMAWGENHWQVDVAAEHLRATDGKAWNGKAQVSYTIGDARLGAGFYKASANDQEDMAEVFAQFALLAHLDVTALIRGGQGQDPLAVVAGHYALSSKTSADVAMAFEQHIASVEMGLSFQF